MSYHTIDRRALLRAGATAATVGVAGCSELDSVVDGGGTESDESLDLREIRMGETRKGHIDEGDEQDPVYDDLAEPVSFEAESGQRVGVGMQAETFDPYVVLTDEKGNAVGEDDDSGEGDDSRLEVTLEEGGTYTIWAGSFSGDATGDYRLSLETAADGSDLREIAFGQTREGRIDGDDPTDPVRGELAEPVSFEASADQAALISMESERIDPYLVLTDGDGNLVAENDDGPSGLDSRMEPVLPEDGTYTIWAGAFETEATGPYALSLEEGTAPETTDLREIDFGQTREGYIDGSDPRDPARNELAEPVSFRGSADQAVVISMESDAVDSYLVLTDADGAVVAQNDDADGLDSRINAVLPEDGSYTIWAGAFETAATGRYTLSLEEGTVPETTDLREIDFGQTREGYIDSQDGRDPRYDDLAEPVSFEASSGTRVRITMESSAVDSFVVLADGEGTVVAENDDGPSGLDSRLETTLERGGSYTIWAGSLSGGATGPYTLTLERV